MNPWLADDLKIYVEVVVTKAIIVDRDIKRQIDKEETTRDGSRQVLLLELVGKEIRNTFTYEDVNR